jgi:hypothetical protein
VSDGTRTRDILDHNQVLYQLSYTHHAAPTGAGDSTMLPALRGAGTPGYRPLVNDPSARAAAAAWACSVVGPGGGTNSVLR